MAGDIDFKEIERAMADLVSKTQTHAREKQLNKVTKERDEIAKKIDNQREQGQVATKRIIIGNKGRLQASGVDLGKSRLSYSTPAPETTPRTGNPSRIINDFTTTPPAAVPTLPDSKLNQTVGDLSNEFLKEEVAEQPLTMPEENLAEPEFSPAPEPTNAIEPSAPSEPVPAPETTPPEEESVLAPEPIAQPEPTIDSNIGAVHRMYGQRMQTPPNPATSDKAPALVAAQSLAANRKIKPRKKKGFLFYFVLLLALAAAGVWGYIGYLFFVGR